MRRSFELVLLYVMLTASSNLLNAAVPSINIYASSRRADSALQQAQGSFNPGGGLGETLFGALLSAINTVELLFEAIAAFPLVLGNIGVPGPVVAFLTAPFFLVIMYDGLHIMTGRLSR
jgi:hypothetical protein